MQNDLVERKLSIGEASKYLGISIDTLRRWEGRGRITPFRSPGGHRYYTAFELDKLFNKKYVRDEFSQNDKVNIPEPPPAEPQIEKINLSAEPSMETPVMPAVSINNEIQAEVNSEVVSAPSFSSIPEVPQPQIIASPVPTPTTPQPEVNINESILNPVVQESSLSQNQEVRLHNILNNSKVSKSDGSEKLLIIGVIMFTILDVGLFVIWYTSTKIAVPIP